MPISQDFVPGDFLVFQLESGFSLLRVLAVDEDNDPVWHLAAYRDFYLDADSAEAAAQNPAKLAIEKSHIALTNRAFESTQVARLTTSALTGSELAGYEKWKSDPNREISDRSVRLMLGLR